SPPLGRPAGTVRVASASRSGGTLEGVAAPMTSRRDAIPVGSALRARLLHPMGVAGAEGGPGDIPDVEQGRNERQSRTYRAISRLVVALQPHGRASLAR